MSTHAERALVHALRGWWALAKAQATEGPVPTPSLLKGRRATIERAWKACPEPETISRRAESEWHQATGRCPDTGRPMPCRCEAAA